MGIDDVQLKYTNHCDGFVQNERPNRVFEGLKTFKKFRKTETRVDDETGHSFKHV